MTHELGSPPAGSAGRVVVVGAINVDFVVAVERLPGPGETVVGARLERHGGGKGANAAVAAARAGATVRLVGAVGADETGSGAMRELRAEGIDVSDVAELDSEATGVALIVVDSHGENQIAVGAGANAAVTPNHVRLALGAALRSGDCVLVSTEISGEAVTAAVEAATAAGVQCVLNPAPAVPAVLRLLEYGPLLTPNATESADLVAMLEEAAAGGGGDLLDADGSPQRAMADGGRELLTRTGAPVVVTLGGDGAMVLTPDGKVENLPAPSAVVRDTTGAGDTFNGVLAARIAVGDRLEAAVRIAMVAASLSVTQVGARDGMPWAAAIEAATRTG